MTPQPNCPSLCDLEALVEGAPITEFLAKHLEDCSSCAETLRVVQDNLTFLQSSAQPLKEFMEESRTENELPSLSGYRILEEIHRGGQGVVYKALQTRTKRDVAIKMLRPDRRTSRKRLQRFELEIEVAAGLRHPGIVTLYETFPMPDGRLGFSMEFVDGVPIDEFVQEQLATLPKRKFGPIIQLLQKVCDAVQYAHQHGIVHRDLKPGNILVDRDEEPRVLDFGLAKLQLPDPDTEGTRPGEFLGSIAFASPEQMKGKPELVDTRTDVYSLGVLCYRFLTGRHPFELQSSLPDIIESIVAQDPREPARVDASIDAELSAIVMRALAKDPDSRYASPAALANDLENYLMDLPIEAMRHEPWYVFKKALRRYRTIVTGAAAIFLVVSCLAVISMILYRQSRENEEIAERHLRSSNVERARALVASSNSIVAEEILWHEHLAGRWELAPGHSGSGYDYVGPSDSFWALWGLYAQQPCLATALAHEGAVRDLALVPGQKGHAVTVGGDDRILLWDLSDAVQLEPTRYVESAGLADRIVFNASGTRLAAVRHTPGTVWIYDTRTRKLVHTLDVDFGSHRVVGATRRECVYVESDGTLVRLDMESFATERYPEPARSATESRTPRSKALAFFEASPDDKTILLGARTIRWIESLNLETRERRRIRTPGSAWDVHWRKDGEPLVAGGEGQDVLVWGLHSGKIVLRVPQAHGSPTRGVQFDSRGSVVISSGYYDHSFKAWHLSGEPIATYRGHANLLTLSTFTRDGHRIVSGCKSGLLKVWEIDPRGCFKTLPGHNRAVFDAAYSPDGRQLVTIDFDGKVVLRDGITGQPLADQWIHGLEAGASVAFSRSGRYLALGGHNEDPRILVCDLDERSVIELLGHTRWVSQLEFHPREDRWLASSSGDATAWIWDIAEQKRVTPLGPESATRATTLHGIAFNHDGSRIATWGRLDAFGHTWIRTLPDGELLRELPGQTMTDRSGAFSSRGTFALGHDDGNIDLIDVDGRFRVLRGHRTAVFSLAFDPTGQVLASGSHAGVIKLWDTRSAQLLTTLEGHGNSFILSLSFSPDGVTLVSGASEMGGTTQTLGIWDLHYYQSHIVGNLRYQAGRLEATGVATRNRDEVERWVNRGSLSSAPERPRAK